MAFAKRVVTPDGAPAWASPDARVDNTMVKALARAFRWRKLLETGDFATVEEIATAEKVNASYVGRVLRLTLLAPDIVEAIPTGAARGDDAGGTDATVCGGVDDGCGVIRKRQQIAFHIAATFSISFLGPRTSI